MKTPKASTGADKFAALSDLETGKQVGLWWEDIDRVVGGETRAVVMTYLKASCLTGASASC